MSSAVPVEVSNEEDWSEELAPGQWHSPSYDQSWGTGVYWSGIPEDDFRSSWGPQPFVGSASADVYSTGSNYSQCGRFQQWFIPTGTSSQTSVASRLGAAETCLSAGSAQRRALSHDSGQQRQHISLCKAVPMGNEDNADTQRMHFLEWLREVDPTGSLDEYCQLLVERYSNPGMLIARYGSGSSSESLGADFLAEADVVVPAHQQLFAHWFSANQSLHWEQRKSKEAAMSGDSATDPLSLLRSEDDCFQMRSDGNEFARPRRIDASHRKRVSFEGDGKSMEGLGASDFKDLHARKGFVFSDCRDKDDESVSYNVQFEGEWSQNSSGSDAAANKADRRRHVGVGNDQFSLEELAEYGNVCMEDALPASDTANSSRPAKVHTQEPAVLEEKVDPEDNKVYTLNDVKRKYCDELTMKEVMEYWELAMRPSTAKIPARQTIQKPAERSCAEDEHRHGSLQLRRKDFCVDSVAHCKATNAATSDHGPERRVDPSDGMAYTLAEFMPKHKGKMSFMEIRRLWRQLVTACA